MKKIFMIIMVVLLAFSVPCHASVFDDVMEKFNLADLISSDVGNTYNVGEDLSVSYTIENFNYDARKMKIEVEIYDSTGNSLLTETCPDFNVGSFETVDGTMNVGLDLPVGDYEVRVRGYEYVAEYSKWADSGTADRHDIVIVDGSVVDETVEETVDVNETETVDDLLNETVEDEKTPDIEFEETLGEENAPSVTDKITDSISNDEGETNWLLYGGIAIVLIIFAVIAIGGGIYLAKKK